MAGMCWEQSRGQPESNMVLGQTGGGGGEEGCLSQNTNHDFHDFVKGNLHCVLTEQMGGCVAGNEMLLGVTLGYKLAYVNAVDLE